MTTNRADTIERIARAFYDVRRPFYVPPWAEVSDDHAIKDACLRDARIALDVIAGGVLVGAVEPFPLSEEER